MVRPGTQRQEHNMYSIITALEEGKGREGERQRGGERKGRGREGEKGGLG